MEDRSPKYSEEIIDINLIDFYDKNPRIQQSVDSKIINGINEISQSELELSLSAKTKKYIDELKESIEVNGLLEPIYVFKNKERFVVVEGNTRLLVYKRLFEKFNSEKWKYIKCRIINQNIENIDFIMLEYHLGGKKPWDAYERARYLFELKNRYTLDDISRQSRRSKSLIENDIKAFEVMNSYFLPKYSLEADNPLDKFSFFVELVKNRELNRLIKTEKISIEEFCDWVYTKKIHAAIDVRDLPDIFKLGGVEVEEEFKKYGYERAMDLLASIKPDATDPLYKSISKVISEINSLTLADINEINSPNSEKKKLLIQLKSVLDKLLK